MVRLILVAKLDFIYWHMILLNRCLLVAASSRVGRLEENVFGKDVVLLVYMKFVLVYKHVDKLASDGIHDLYLRLSFRFAVVCYYDCLRKMVEDAFKLSCL